VFEAHRRFVSERRRGPNRCVARMTVSAGNNVPEIREILLLFLRVTVSQIATYRFGGESLPLPSSRDWDAECVQSDREVDSRSVSARRQRRWHVARVVVRLRAHLGGARGAWRGQ
jgi:hypothetical protein